MKPKHKPKFIALTTYNIAIGEFKNKRDLNNWIKRYKGYPPIIKIITGTDIENLVYLPIF
jgi:hypothetical protein